MHRRTFLASATGAVGLSLLPVGAQASMIDYEPGALEPLLAQGKTLFIDFYASWCGTCQAQRRVIQSLWDENPAYLEHLTFVEVDWDTYGQGELSKSLQIPRRSTLVTMAPDGREIGRVVAGTKREVIKALMDDAVAVAMASS